jgi:hypothetical protein
MMVSYPFRISQLGVAKYKATRTYIYGSAAKNSKLRLTSIY